MEEIDNVKRSGIVLILIPMLCLGFLMAAFAGTTGKISGRVIDSETGDPLPGVNVVIENTRMGAATDAAGDYFILNVPPGTYTIEASMMGFRAVSQTDVQVNIDRTIKVDFRLQPASIQGEEVTVVARRDVVRKDVSASQIAIPAEKIKEVPLVNDVRQMINLQAGVEDDLIRGGGLDQTGLVVDGLTMVNNADNEPLMMVNLSAMEEVSIIKGGFNAEYGNIRSGLINIVTKQGAWGKYNGSVDYRYGIAHQKHRGASLFDPNNYYLRPYLDPAVCWVGTANGGWDSYTQQQYRDFEGWNAVSNRLMSDEDPSNDLTPEQARDLFIWQHRADGSEALGHPQPGGYGDKPDYNIDASFGGPVPLVGKYLGKMTFFASYRRNVERPIIPAQRDFYERNAMFKMTSVLSSSMKLGVEGLFGRVEDPGGGSLPDGYDRGIYFIHASQPLTVNQSMVGITFDHVLSPRTYYNVRISRVDVKNGLDNPLIRNEEIIKNFGPVGIDESPWGFRPTPGYQYAIADQMVIGGVGGGEVNDTKVSTYNAKLDFTSQVNKYNQVQAGFEVNVDDHSTYYGTVHGLDPTDNYVVKWQQEPVRGGAYLQDKLEFQGLIANLGLRLDYNDPNTNWYTVNRYSKYFSRVFKDQFNENAPTEPAKGHLKIAPRLGISHPITEKSKLYFNYGHFYSMPLSEVMYQINYGTVASGISEIGNPNLDLPRTIAYELGYEHEIGNMFLVSLSGYYKDVTDQWGDVRYVNYDGSVDYTTYNNSNYADIRGFELRLEKRWGRWITGWMNYNYMVETSGYFGREEYYQDPRQQAVYGLRNPKQEKPLARPYARANLQVMAPQNWGPTVAGMKPFSDLGVSALFQYKAGEYVTWEPVAPFTAVNNVQWKPYYNFDLRISKRTGIGRYNFTVFADVTNLFDTKLLSNFVFNDEYDYRDYMNSLHLPIYNQAKYKNLGFTAGDDKPGDVRSKDKPYINMPNIDFQAWNAPRSVVLGLTLDF